MTIEEWEWFRAEDKICPWGPERGDLQAGIIAQTVLEASSKSFTVPKLEKFVLRFVTNREIIETHRNNVKDSINRAKTGWSARRGK
jgi:hypothetical protein